MKLSELTIHALPQFISGDNNFSPYLSGRDILKIFNLIGFKDVYQPEGMPENVSRNKYILDRLIEINSHKELVQLLKIIFNPVHFNKDSSKDLQTALDALNSILVQDGYKIEPIDGVYTVIGADIPEEIEVEVYFEEIEQQIIEQIRNARFTIWIAVAWFTNRNLMQELFLKTKEGVNVRLVVLDDDINSKYGFNYEKVFETKRYSKTGQFENIMHHKFCIIDFCIIIHGSYNWTTKANWNKETISIETSRPLAEKYASEFISLIK